MSLLMKKAFLGNERGCALAANQQTWFHYYVICSPGYVGNINNVNNKTYFSLRKKSNKNQLMFISFELSNSNDLEQTKAE